MAVKLVTATESVIELRDIPFEDWPEECKECAMTILASPKLRQEFMQELFKLEWLVVKVEKRMEANRALMEDLGLSVFGAAKATHK
jgi:hypothetical protein